MEFAHISNTGTVQFKLLNPVVMNFRKYEEKLENQMKIYEKYLADKIWNSLTTNERQNLELNYPFEMNESNRDKLLSALEYAEWPVSKQDIELIEYQIYLAKIFMQQSKDLHDYLREKQIIREEKHVNYSFDSALNENNNNNNTMNTYDTNKTAHTDSHRSEVNFILSS